MATDPQVMALTELVTDLLTMQAKLNKAEVKALLVAANNKMVMEAKKKVVGSQNTKARAAEMKVKILENVLYAET
jgi:hypothetical protein